MAFNFHGTYTTGQFNTLNEFAKKRLYDIQGRIKYLEQRRESVGRFTTDHDGTSGLPIKYDCNPPTSYGKKLLRAFCALGGKPEELFILRTDTIYLTTGTKLSENPSNNYAGYSNVLSSGRVTWRGRNDGARGVFTTRFKSFMIDSIKYKVEHLEYKIKRALDYSESLLNEIDLLKSMIDPNHPKYIYNSIENMTKRLDINQSRESTFNVVQNDEDIFGYKIGNLQDPNMFYNPDQALAYAERGATASSPKVKDDSIFSTDI